MRGGSGIEVSGNGSAATPYVIDSTGDFSGSIAAVSTDTIQMSTSGSGTALDPLQISARATMDMQDLLDVSDAAGPQEGEVPVWTTDHWEFKVPASAPPGTVNRGAGIVGDGSAGNPLLAAISGIWGSGSMAGFPADTTLGNPIYTDALGQLRGRPVPVVRHGTNPFSALAGWSLGSTSRWVQYGNIVEVYLIATRTGATIPGSASGDIGNVPVAALVSGVPKPVTAGSFAAVNGRMVGAFIDANGQANLGVLPPNASFPNGSYFSAMAIYVTADVGLVL